MASLLYIVWNDVVAANQWEGYSPKTQAISELSSVGAPSRGVLVPWFNISYSALMVLFGIAVWRSGRDKKELRLAGALLVAYGIMGPLWLPFPMSLREEIAAGNADAMADTAHVVMSGVTLVIWLTTIWFGGKAFGKPFRWYSLVTAAAVVVFGGLTGVQSARIAAGEATPWLGIVERAMFAAFFCWIVAISSRIWHTHRGVDVGGERMP